MKYAVVKIQGSQFKVTEGEEIEVSSLSANEGEKIELSEVLLAVNNSEVKIGKPLVEGAKVTATVLKNFLGPKLDIFKFKAKTGYRRKIGFRPKRTLLKIEKITSSKN